MKGIYETKGRAREFCELAINHYRGCGHKCVYCYGATVTHTEPDQFFNHPVARYNILEQVKHDALELCRRGETRPILLSFVTDPYQPIDLTQRLTRQVIKVLKDNYLKVTILTKAGLNARVDLDLLEPGRDTFATSLTCHSDACQRRWEPLSGEWWRRINNLEVASHLGLDTWVSLEPVLYPASTFELIRASMKYVGHYKVGTLNYHEHAKNINWERFANQVIELLDKEGKPYYIKKDLGKYIGHPEGLRVGI